MKAINPITASIFIYISTLMCLQVNGYATDFYIDNDATGANTGTSWSDAWQEFQFINWNNINSGDTVYISGGNVSKTYNEKLSVGKSGTSGNYITITKGNSPGHNGTVNIAYSGAANGWENIGIEIFNKSYVIVKGLNADDSPYAALAIRFNSNNIIVDSCNLNATGRAAIIVTGSQNITIKNNTITSDTAYINDQADGIYLQDGMNNIVEGNTIIINNTNEIQHCDLIQSYRERDLTVKNNYMTYGADSSANKNGLYLSTNYGTFYVYNNIIIGQMNASSTTFGFINYAADGKIFAYNNVVKAGVGGTFNITGPNSVVKNNIFYTTRSNIVGGYVGQNPSNINNNIYLNGGSPDIVTLNGSTRLTWEEWQSMGYDQQGISADPLVDAEYRLKNNSPCINAGTNLDSVFNTDKDGNIRGFLWDIGAYEKNIGDAAGTPLAPPTGLRIK